MRCEGPQTVIINERNKVAISELKKALSGTVVEDASNLVAVPIFLDLGASNMSAWGVRAYT
jgi:hypothetical protein